MSRLVHVGGGTRWRAASVSAALALLVIGCTPTASTKLLTDARQIMVAAIHSTAALSYARLHADAAVSMAGMMGGGVAGEIRLSMDADVDLARREIAGRMTTEMPAAFNGPGNTPSNQIQEFISLSDASYSRTGGIGRWTKFSTGGGGAPLGPSNAQIATVLENLLGEPGVAVALGEAAACSLGTCYHVTATVDGPAALQAISAATGMPPGAVGGVTIPPLVFELLIDQATGVLSELRIQTAIQGTSLQAAVLLSNPDLVVQLVAPPAALVDDVNVGGNGGFGPAPTPAESLGP